MKHGQRPKSPPHISCCCAALYVPFQLLTPLPMRYLYFFDSEDSWITSGLHIIHMGLQTFMTMKHYCKPLQYVDECCLMKVTCYSVVGLGSQGFRIIIWKVIGNNKAGEVRCQEAELNIQSYNRNFLRHRFSKEKSDINLNQSIFDSWAHFIEGSN